MNEEWDALMRRTQRHERRLGRVEASAALSGVWTAPLSAAQSEAVKTLFSVSRGRMVRISYYVIASQAVSVTVSLNGQAQTFSHAAGNPCMMLILPLSQGNNLLSVRVSAGAAGITQGRVSAEQLDTQI